MNTRYRMPRLLAPLAVLALALAFGAATPSSAHADRWNHRSHVKPKIHRFHDSGRYQRSLREYRLKRHSGRASRRAFTHRRHFSHPRYRFNRFRHTPRIIVTPRFRPDYGRRDSRERRRASVPLTVPGSGRVVSAAVAWDHLAEGRIGVARSSFAAAAQASPQKGAPNVGFALSTAAGGDLIGGAKAMRRALRLDPGAFQEVKVDTRLTPLLGDIARRYEAAPAGAISRSDTAFMLASLSYLSGDLPDARTAIAGDRHNYPSTRNLKEIVETADNTRPTAVLAGDSEPR